MRSNPCERDIAKGIAKAMMTNTTAQVKAVRVDNSSDAMARKRLVG
jgi:hypothetical protein